MQITPNVVRTDVPTAPTNRTEAAQALAAMPSAIAMVATMTAMTKSMAGEQASRADLVAPILEKLTPEQAKLTIINAIDGAIALAPELAPKSDALRQAAAGVEALLIEAAADKTLGSADEALGRLMTPLEPLMAPILEAALVLDPEFGKEDPTAPQA